MAGSINLFIAQLDRRVDDALLRKEFEKFGEILCAEVTKDDQGTSMGFGFVHFNCMADGLKAIKEMNGKTFFSRSICIDIANKQVPPKKSDRRTIDTSKAKSNGLLEFPSLETVKAKCDALQVDELNMSNSDKLEDCKKEIRSILITYQKGCYLTDLIRSFKDLIGKRLPSRELGFKTDIDFLYSMPDVVRVTPSRGDYHLLGIADEKSYHIQKMVCRQKPSKGRPPPVRISRAYSRFSASTPPRFSESNFKPVKYLPEAKSWPVENSASIHANSTSVHANAVSVQANPTSALANSVSPKEEVVSLVKQFKNGIALTSLLREYEKVYNKSFSVSDYGFFSLEECIDNVSELDIINLNNEPYVIYRSEFSSKFSEKDGIEKMQEDFISSSNKKDLLTSTNNEKGLHYHDESFKENSSDAPKSDYSRSKICDNSNIPQSMISKLKKVAGRYSQGVLSSKFPLYFEEVTTTTLDLYSLGYKSLADFIDDVPDIFVRKSIKENKTDYLIYPTEKLNLELNGSHSGLSGFPEIGPAMIDNIISNIRRILEAYSEGIPINEFLHVYSLNCKDSLNVNDFGFNNLLNFLFNIKERVPLKFEILNGVKIIHLVKMSDHELELPYTSALACEQEGIPFDAEFPEFEFKLLSLPKKFDFTKYFPVYVSSVVHPGHLYIQLQKEEWTSPFEKLADDLENFYHGEKSKLYAMKDVHIKPGASCAALWPVDQHWYRAQILSIQDMETVRVHYVDYGTRENIPKSLLRYLKKEYVKAPGQALRCSLAFIKPAKNATQWDLETKQRLLKMCADIPLMAKIEEITEKGVYSIVLCDTNGEKDVYINDVLRAEGLADYFVESEPTNSIPTSPVPLVTAEPAIPEPVQPENYHSLTPLQALQAQYFLQAFAAVAPSFAQNEHYLTLLRQISMHCPNVDPMKSNPALGAQTANSFPFSNQSVMNSNLLTNSYPGAAAAFQGTSDYTHKNNMLNGFIPPEKDYSISPPIRSPTPTDLYSLSTGYFSVENHAGDSEIFDDDDDDFEELCQKFSTKSRRFVKRVILGDGNKIHIILVNAKPFVSSGDISRLIWNNQEADYLMRKLQQKEEDIPTLTLSQDGNEELFFQLEKLNVKGVQKTTGFKASIFLYPLNVVIKILNVFGHPSISLRKKLQEEILCFNPNDQIWQEFFVPEISESDENEDDNIASETDDDKIQKLCLVDLNVLKDSIKCRRLKMMNRLQSSDGTKYVDEITNLEKMQLKVISRIEEIKQICTMFA